MYVVNAVLVLPLPSSLLPPSSLLFLPPPSLPLLPHSLAPSLLPPPFLHVQFSQNVRDRIPVPLVLSQAISLLERLKADDYCPYDIKVN